MLVILVTCGIKIKQNVKLQHQKQDMRLVQIILMKHGMEPILVTENIIVYVIQVIPFTTINA